MFKHLVRAAIQWLLLFPVRVVLILLGALVVPLALPFARTLGAAVPFTQAPGNWQLVVLPAWAWLWSNDRDGALGDKRGWWHLNAPFGLGAYHWFSKLWWLALRNPANNMRFSPLFGCPVTECDYRYWGDENVEDRPGEGGCRLLLATHTSAPSAAITASTAYGNGPRLALWWCRSASRASRKTGPKTTPATLPGSGPA